MLLESIQPIVFLVLDFDSNRQLFNSSRIDFLIEFE